MKFFSFVSRLFETPVATPVHSSDELRAKAEYIAARDLWLRREAALNTWAHREGHMNSLQQQTWERRACGWLKIAEANMQTARIAYEHALKEVQ